MLFKPLDSYEMAREIQILRMESVIEQRGDGIVVQHETAPWS
jgi:hypothetical protein